MTRDYAIKLLEEKSDDKYDFLVRKVSLANVTKRTYPLGKAFPFQDVASPRHGASHLNEVFLKLRTDRISDINNDNEAADALKANISGKSSQKKFNIPFIDLPYELLKTKKSKETALEVLTDFVYANPKIDMIVPPRIDFPEQLDTPIMYKKYIDFLDTFCNTIEDTIGDFKPAFLIPDFLNRNQVPEIIDHYFDRFGGEPLVVIDHNGKTFTSYSSRSFLILRTLKRVLKSDDFALYCFNVKARKRSGEAVPSEDFLAIYNGVSFLGPSHKPSFVPQSVRDELSSASGKVFSKRDLRYHPLSTKHMKNRLDDPTQFLEKGVGIQSLSSLSSSDLKRLNEISTEERMNDVVNDSKLVLSSLTYGDFSKDLGELGRKRKRTILNKSLNDFF